MSDLLGLWPAVALLVGALLRVLEADVRSDQVGRASFLAELLAAYGTALIVAGGVGLGLLFGARVL